MISNLWLGIQSAIRSLQSAISDWRLVTGACPAPTRYKHALSSETASISFLKCSKCLLKLTTYYLLFTSHYLTTAVVRRKNKRASAESASNLPIIYYLLPTSYYLPSTTYYLLFSATRAHLCRKQQIPNLTLKTRDLLLFTSRSGLGNYVIGNW